MKFAVALPQSNRVSSPTGIRDVARAGDELGFWALSMGDHITFDGRWISCGSDSDNGTADVRNIYEPLTTYAHVAALSERVRLLFSIMLLPTREPLVTAKQLATHERLSGGRVLLGLGVGLAGDDTDPPFASLLSANVARVGGTPRSCQPARTAHRRAAGRDASPLDRRLGIFRR